jgi:hypothetical protein
MSAAFAGAVLSGLHLAPTLGPERIHACQVLEWGRRFLFIVRTAWQESSDEEDKKHVSRVRAPNAV